MRCVSHCHVNIPSGQGSSRVDLNLPHLGRSQFLELLLLLQFPFRLILGLSSQHGSQTPVFAPISNEETETASCPQAREEVSLSGLAKGRYVPTLHFIGDLRDLQELTPKDFFFFCPVCFKSFEICFGSL